MDYSIRSSKPRPGGYIPGHQRDTMKEKILSARWLLVMFFSSIAAFCFCHAQFTQTPNILFQAEGAIFWTLFGIIIRDYFERSDRTPTETTP